jgi:two-component sensor histidine kinase
MPPDGITGGGAVVETFVSSFSIGREPLLVRPPRGARAESEIDFGFRLATLRVGNLLGWAVVAAVLTGVAFDLGPDHRWLLVFASLAAAAANTAATLVPWREWLSSRRGRLLLDLWCGGLIAFVALLVATAGSSFALLLFLVAPFLAVAQTGWRRVAWLAAIPVSCSAVATTIPTSAGATAVRLLLVAVVVAITLGLTRAIRAEAAAHRRADARAALERSRAQEANHRIKNDLQTAADLLLLARPDGADGEPFDETAARIRSIATVHRLLTETGPGVDGETLLRRIASGAPVPVDVRAEAVTFDADTAQRLGIVANELVTNAFRHGAAPIVVRLDAGPQTRLRVEDAGVTTRHAGGFGLDLVRQVVEHGLGGRFELRAGPTGEGTHAEVTFPARSQ